MQRVFVFLAFLCVAAIAFAAEKPTAEPNDLFGKLRIRLLDKNGVELKGVADAAATEKAQSPGLVRQKFLFQEKEIVVESCVDPATRTIVYRIESPFLESGDVGLGLQFPKEKRLPKVSVAGNRATFEGKRGKFLVGWTGSATLTAPKSREELKISLAEYGANDRWADVTETVRDFIVGDTLEIRAGNLLFGDPAGGVVKNLILTYSVGDEDEKIETFTENQLVKIQFDPKDRFFRLNVDKKSAFEFVVASKLETLPETLPTFEEAKKHAASVDVPGIH